ncbi:MAG TPA: hypothetical protein VKA53_04205 [Thermoanaerobaculia bacterium]|nr:hypothetical protein [Thermoanaerobaculia bacterium]
MRNWRRTLTGLALLALFVSVEALAPLPQFHHDKNELGDLFAAAAAAAAANSSAATHHLATAQLLAADSPFDCPACMLLGMAVVGSGHVAAVGLPTVSSRAVSRPLQQHHVSLPHPFDGRAPPAA